MRRFLHSKNFKAMIAAFVLLAALRALSGLGINPLSDLLDGISSGICAVEAAAEGAATGDEAEELRSENAELRTRLADYLDTKRENEALRKYFDLSEDNPTYTVLPAEVIRRGSGGVTLTLNAGGDDGVEVNDPVIGENGLVGRVSAVRARFCTVTTLLSPETKASVRDTDASYSAVVSGSAETNGENSVCLTKISQTGRAERGDVVITSGVGGAYPEGLLVGTVTETEPGADGERVQAAVEPCEDPSALTFAAIITEF